MLFPDVNILIHALRPDADAQAEAVADWFEQQLNAHETIGISELVLSAAARIVTRPGVFATATTPEQFMQFADALLAAPVVQVVRPGPRHWAVFGDLVRGHRLRGNDIPDAYLASLSIEVGATFVTRDRGFRRFDALRTLDPLVT
ncbi:MAG: PIN domain-containing protein [Aeromicrobium sp.]|uniref:TA system VapC family ribonuclease toxin n=1 Tax=Aeromicrobium sp. TaxID=1871063 RepID=UPI0039E40BB1